MTVSGGEQAPGWEKKQSLREHLMELRRRLIYSVIALVLTTPASFSFVNPLLIELKSRAPAGVQFISIKPTEMFEVYIRVALISGFILALPFIILQILLFIRPALKPNESRGLYIILISATLSFLIGGAFAYFVLIPPSLKFLLTFATDIATPYIRIGDYISLITRLVFWVGVIFETPLIIFFLIRSGLVTVQKLSRARRWIIVGAFIMGAFITPTPDPVNQTFVALPLIILFEIGLLLGRLAQRKRVKKAKSD